MLFRRTFLGLLAMVAATAGVISTSASARASQGGSLVLASDDLVPGQFVTITGSGWDKNTVFQASVCGARAAAGSVDCAIDSAATFSVNVLGTVDSKIAVVIPPKPCPCVVLITSTTGYLNRLPVTIAGARSTLLESQSPVTNRIEVVQAQMVGSTPLSEWFGLSATRTIELKLRNTGVAPVPSSAVFATLGLRPVGSQQLHSLEPDRLTTYFVAVHIPAFSLGRLTILGHVSGGESPVSFKVPFSIWPYGLLIAALIILQIVLLALRNRARRRHEANLSRGTPPTDDAMADTGQMEPVSSGVGAGDA